jgi:Carboxypeptidase regulatory-like domain
VISSKKVFCNSTLLRFVRTSALGSQSVLWLSLICVGSVLPVRAQSQQDLAVPAIQNAQSNGPSGTSDGSHLSDMPSVGTVKGTVVDRTGAVVAGARVRFIHQDQTTLPETLSDNNGQFSFAKVPPGSFQLTVTATGFAPQVSSGTVHPGEIYTVPPIALTVATALTEVRVGLSQVEVAQQQVEDEEKQRVLGFIPNFYVSYDPHPAPLTSKQKFALAWKTTIDPVSFALIGVIAGVQQSQDQFSGYGQGAEGYGKRYGASYANFVSGTFIGGAILPSLLKQDPRYFYKGTGSKRSRILYAIAMSVICKGDNGRWQPNYSSIGGNLAAGAISNLYYPEKDRDGVGLTFEGGAIGIGATAGANLIEEFLIRKLTPNVPKP